MDPHVSHLSDDALRRGLVAALAEYRAHTAEQMAAIAEAEARQLHLTHGFTSILEYAERHLHLDEDDARVLIEAGRAARRFPVLFGAVADGRLHAAAVALLAPYLTAENIDELIDAAARRSETEICAWLLDRFPLPDVPTTVTPISPEDPGPELEVWPLGRGRYAVRLIISGQTYEAWQRAQALLGDAGAPLDPSEVLASGLQELILELEAQLETQDRGGD